MTNTETEDQQQQQQQPTKADTTTTIVFQTANELLNKVTIQTTTKTTIFDNPLEMELSRIEELIRDGYCQHCINTKKEVEKCRKITNKLNLFAHYCNVCTSLFSVGTEFLTAMKSLDDFELLSLDEAELLVIKSKDKIIYDRILKFKKQFSTEEGVE